MKDFRNISIWIAHYALLTAVLFLGYFSANKYFDLEALTQGQFGWIILFVWYFLFVAIGDSLIKKIFKWR